MYVGLLLFSLRTPQSFLKFEIERMNFLTECFMLEPVESPLKCTNIHQILNKILNNTLCPGVTVYDVT